MMKKIMKQHKNISATLNEQILITKSRYSEKHTFAWNIRCAGYSKADEVLDATDTLLKEERNKEINTLQNRASKLLRDLENTYFSQEGKQIFDLLTSETVKQLNEKPLQKSVFQSIILDYGKPFPKERYQKLANLALRIDGDYSFEHIKKTVLRLIICDTWMDGNLSESNTEKTTQ